MTDMCYDGGTRTLTVPIDGELDHHVARPLRERIDRRLYETRPTVLRLDFSAVSFMDSSGLGLIMGRLSVVRELGGSLTVRNPSDAISRIIHLAGMDKILDIEQDGGQAITPPRATRRRRKPIRTEGKVAK